MLAHDVIAGPDADRALLMLHGILGRGQNWRSLARRLAERRPAWAFVTVDLRLHGASRDVPGPHDLAAAAADLDALAGSLSLPVHGVAGHSFGGKVALSWAATRPGLAPVVLLDSNPGARPERQGAIAKVLGALRAAPGPFADRRAFVEAMKGEGLEEPIARWLALNLHRDEAGLRFGVDMDGVDALLADYFARDLWAALEAQPAGWAILATRSEVWNAEDRARAQALLGPRCVSVDANHWLHVDAPDATLAALEAALEG